MSRRERQRRRRLAKGGPLRIILLSGLVLVALGAIGAISAVGYVVSIANSAPELSSLKPTTLGQNTRVYASDGKTQLGVIQASVLRQQIPSSSIPQDIKDATVAIEDKRFFQHKGVDFEGVVRAAVKNVKSDKTVQGGSTLTMQLIKNMYTEDRTRSGLAGFKRKVREAKLAEDLEDLHPGREGKEWILAKYLNSVPYGTAGGQNAYGVQAAARIYFNKPAHELTLPEAALLAGLPQAPTDYNPYLHKARAKQRRNEVLGQMVKTGAITPEQAAKAAATPVRLHPTTYYKDRREAYFFNYVQKELVKRYGKQTVKEGGLKVYTTIDLRLQKLARAKLRGNLNSPASPAGALISMSPRTGKIRAMASSTSYADSKLNLATQGKRQPGSTFKPIVLMDALHRGVSIRTTYVSKRLLFTDPKWGKIDVTTSDGSPSGKPKTLFDAIKTSDNTVFQQLDLDLGPESVTRTAYAMGVTNHVDTYPSTALGGLKYGVSVLDMARAYATINNGGYRVKPIAITKVVFPDGHVDRSLGKPKRVKVFTDGETGEAIKAMQANVAGGTGTRAQLPNCLPAGKTGTTSNFTDAWFDGMVRGLNTAVWVGYPKSTTSMTAAPWKGGGGEMFGGDAPAQIWHDFMADVVTKKDCRPWPAPKQPFVARPFFGRYVDGGAKLTGDTAGDPEVNPVTGEALPRATAPGDTGAGTPAAKDTGTGGANDKGKATGKGTGATPGTGTGGGGTAYDPAQYETPPDAPAAGATGTPDTGGATPPTG